MSKSIKIIPDILENACIGNDIERIKEYLSQSIQNQDFSKAQDLLTISARYGSLDIVKLLCSRLNLKYLEAFKSASQNDQLNVIEYFVSQKIDKESLNWGFTSACYGGATKAVKFLIEKGADIHHEKEEGFRVASRAGYLDIVKYLTKETANPIDIYSMDAIGVHGAIASNQIDLVNYYLYDMQFQIPAGFEQNLEKAIHRKSFMIHLFNSPTMSLNEFKKMVEKRDLFFKLDEQLKNSHPKIISKI